MGYNFNLSNRKSLRGWVVFVRADAVLGVDTGSRGSHLYCWGIHVLINCFIESKQKLISKLQPVVTT